MSIVSAERLRNRNLDLLRAVAIAMVVVYHAAQTTPLLWPVTNYGEYGVDLFFVLSGWLVGGLYWRERLSFGNVHIFGFWIRRWMRTLPPYFIALFVSWLAVYAVRRQPFDYGYLFFVQNYYTHVPFFSVSWSLCVEEHFYLLAPLLLLAWQRTRKIRPTWFILALLLAPLCRFLIYGDEYSLYFKTATHLRIEGLIVGLWLSYLSTEEPQTLRRLLTSAPYGVVAGVALLFCLALVGGRLGYTLWGTAVALFFSAALLCLLSRDDVGTRVARVASAVSLSSYSVYLTHAWAIYAALKLVERLPDLGAVYFPLALLLITALGVSFYYLVERPSIRIRDVLWPRRGGLGFNAPAPSPGVALNAALATNTKSRH